MYIGFSRQPSTWRLVGWLPHQPCTPPPLPRVADQTRTRATAFSALNLQAPAGRHGAGRCGLYMYVGAREREREQTNHIVGRSSTPSNLGNPSCDTSSFVASLFFSFFFFRKSDQVSHAIKDLRGKNHTGAIIRITDYGLHDHRQSQAEDSVISTPLTHTSLDSKANSTLLVQSNP